MRGTRTSASRSRFATSQVATPTPAAATPMNTFGTNSRMAMSDRPRPRPTAKAAGRLRPAREAGGAGSSELFCWPPAFTGSPVGPGSIDPSFWGPGVTGLQLESPPLVGPGAAGPGGVAPEGVAIALPGVTGVAPWGAASDVTESVCTGSGGAASGIAAPTARPSVASTVPLAGLGSSAAPVAAAFSATIVPSLNSSFRSSPARAGPKDPASDLRPRAVQLPCA